MQLWKLELFFFWGWVWKLELGTLERALQWKERLDVQIGINRVCHLFVLMLYYSPYNIPGKRQRGICLSCKMKCIFNQFERWRMHSYCLNSKCILTLFTKEYLLKLHNFKTFKKGNGKGKNGIGKAFRFYPPNIDIKPFFGSIVKHSNSGVQSLDWNSGFYFNVT